VTAPPPLLPQFQELGAPGDAVIFLPQSRRVWMLHTSPAALQMTDLALAQTPASSHTLFGIALTSILHDGPPTESVGRFRAVG
jgi:hypothetical protein